MSAFLPKPGCLAAALTTAAPLQGSIISDGISELRLLGIVDAMAAAPLRGYRGRSVMIAVATQIAAAQLLIQLDGTARRLVLSPPDLKPEHLSSVIRDAEVDTILASPGANIDGHGAQVVAFEEALPPVMPLPIVTDSDTQWLMLTSGTTGEPKIAIHTLAGLTGAISPPVHSDRKPVWATFYDIRRYGGLQIFLRAMLSGASLFLSRPGETIQDHLMRLAGAKVTHISGTPTHWRRALMSEAVPAFSPEYVRLSGEVADQAILDALKAAFPRARIGHAYASTEAGVGFDVTDGLEGFPATFLDEPINGVSLRIFDGCLQIKSSRTALSYAGRPDLSLTDAQGWVDSGDMVVIRNGRCHFSGRRGGIINVGGLKVHPEEVESVINRHRAVRQSRVKPRKSPLIGAIVVADIVLKTGADDGEAVKQEILALCREELPPHKVPAVVNVVAAVEMTPGGKVSRAYA